MLPEREELLSKLPELPNLEAMQDAAAFTRDTLSQWVDENTPKPQPKERSKLLKTGPSSSARSSPRGTPTSSSSATRRETRELESRVSPVSSRPTTASRPASRSGSPGQQRRRAVVSTRKES